MEFRLAPDDEGTRACGVEFRLAPDDEEACAFLCCFFSERYGFLASRQLPTVYVRVRREVLLLNVNTRCYF